MLDMPRASAFTQDPYCRATCSSTTQPCKFGHVVQNDILQHTWPHAAQLLACSARDQQKHKASSKPMSNRHSFRPSKNTFIARAAEAVASWPLQQGALGLVQYAISSHHQPKSKETATMHCLPVVKLSLDGQARSWLTSPATIVGANHCLT